MPTDEPDDDDKTGGAAGGDGGAGAPKTVPYDRFQKAVADKNEWKRKFESLGGQSADQYRTQLEEERNGRKADREQFSSEGTLRDAGFNDAEGRELALWAYNRLPKESRAPLAEQLKAWKADPTKAPKAVASYFQPAADAGKAGGDDAGAGAAKGTDAGKDVGKGAAGFPGSRAGTSVGGAGAAAKGEPVSGEKLAQLRAEAVRTGDWGPWNAALGREPNKK